MTSDISDARSGGLAILAGALLASVALAGGAQAQQYDVLIRNGHIYDGAGSPWYGGDVAIKDGRIARIGYLPDASAKRVIDAEGLAVAPGFIDLHTHSDTTLLADGNGESKLRQGVTLDVLGEGGTVAPRDGLPLEKDSNGITPDWTTFTGYFDRLRKSTSSMNVISHVAYGQVKRVVMGYTFKCASPEQLEKMKALVARSMEEGAWGMVSQYDSGGPTCPDEVIELSKVVHKYGGNYTSHIGSEGGEQDKELDFIIRVAREAGTPVHIFHYKIRKPNWDKQQHYIDRINQARAEGVDITVNQYPYTAMRHGWNAFFPMWAREGGPAALAKRLKDPKIREKIKADPDFRAWALEHGDPEGIVYARTVVPAHEKYLGKTLAEISRERGDKDPWETCVVLMAEAGGDVGGIFHTMSEDNVMLLMKQPWVSIGSDAAAENLKSPGFPHPRIYGTNPKVLGHYVRDTHTLVLEDAVRKMSGFPAQILGVQDRGLLKEGFWADVVVFDPATVKDTATYMAPKSYPIGIPYVLVNGVVVIDKGEHTGARPGVPILGPGAKTP